MTLGASQKIYIQRDWTNQELLADGFLSYSPVKRITMARIPSTDETLKTIKVGYWIAYVTGETLKEKGDGYQLCLIEPSVFLKSYKPWDEPNWQPTLAEAYLQRLNCQPYYEIAMVWAKQLSKPIWILGIDCDEILLAPKDDWLCLNTEGKLWTTPQEYFYTRYLLSQQNSFKKSYHYSTTQSKEHLLVTSGPYGKGIRT